MKNAIFLKKLIDAKIFFWTQKLIFIFLNNFFVIVFISAFLKILFFPILDFLQVIFLCFFATKNVTFWHFFRLRGKRERKIEDGKRKKSKEKKMKKDNSQK